MNGSVYENLISRVITTALVIHPIRLCSALWHPSVPSHDINHLHTAAALSLSAFLVSLLILWPGHRKDERKVLRIALIAAFAPALLATTIVIVDGVLIRTVNGSLKPVTESHITLVWGSVFGMTLAAALYLWSAVFVPFCIHLKNVQARH